MTKPSALSASSGKGRCRDGDRASGIRGEDHEVIGSAIAVEIGAPTPPAADHGFGRISARLEFENDAESWPLSSDVSPKTYLGIFAKGSLTSPAKDLEMIDLTEVPTQPDAAWESTSI